MDLLLVKKDCNSLIPKERYDNFFVEFDKHFNTWFHFAEKVKERLPAIALEITRLNAVDDCFSEYEITFHVTLTTTPPNVDTDGDTRAITIGYSEEQILLYRDIMINEIKRMMYSSCFNEEGNLEERTVFSDMLEDPNWKYPLRADVYSVNVDSFRVYTEMLAFKVSFKLGIDNLNCGDYDFKICEDCEENNNG